MFHPLAIPPKNLNDVDLDNKIAELSKKYHIVSSLGNIEIANQMILILDMYRNEQNSRRKAQTDKLMRKQNKDLDDLINVD